MQEELRRIALDERVQQRSALVEQAIEVRTIFGRKPRPLAFRNHKSAMEEQEFVDKEHAANVQDEGAIAMETTPS